MDEEQGDFLSHAHPSRSGGGLDNLVRPFKLDHILQSSPPGEDAQEKHAWNPDNRSPDVLVKDDDKFTAYRITYNSPCGYIKGKMGYSRGFHVWQLTWPVEQRPGFVVGVATKNHESSTIGYDRESYGWCLPNNECYHDDRFPPWNFPALEEGVNKVYCILDMDEGFLAFATDETYLGVAFRGLKGKTLYPAVSVFSNTNNEITMKYLGGLNGAPSPHPLPFTPSATPSTSTTASSGAGALPSISASSSSTESDGSEGVENPARGDGNDGSRENSTKSDESEVVENSARGDDNSANKVDDGKTRARPASVLLTLLSFLPFINSGCTPDGSTGENNDEDDRDETNNDKKPRSFFENLLGNVGDLSRKAARECEEESLRRLEANGWNREQTKKMIQFAGVSILGGLGLIAGGPYAAVASTVIGELLPSVRTIVGSGTVELVDAIGRKVPLVIKLFKNASLESGNGEKKPNKGVTSVIVDAVDRYIPEPIKNIKNWFFPSGNGEKRDESSSGDSVQQE